MSTFTSWLRPDPHRSLHLDLALTASVLCAWFLLGCIQVQVAGSVRELKLVLTPTGWQTLWPLGPWAIAIGALGLLYVRARWTDSAAYLQERIQRIAPFVGALVAIRLLALWPTSTTYFPILTLLWSPHAAWALALTLLAYIHWPTQQHASAKPETDITRESPTRSRTTLYTTLALFLVALISYSAYTIYFCQITMLHGDEGQYLRVTQSLLYDGDMDLANNLEPAQTNEFHVRGFGIHKAPGSPEGKVHSVHPIGLSIAVLPAYWAGLQLWENPRLSSALFMVLLASCCVALLFLWLTRIGISYASALVSTATMASTGPFFLFSNQLFPEVAALFIALIALCTLSHWQVPGGHYRPLGGRFEIVVLALLTLLLSCLPFLHARYTPIGLFAGAGVIAQAWYGSRRNASLTAIAAVVLLGIYALISFHFAFSNDWMGPFRPGNAWEEGALDIATWSISLPGHWLHVGKGMLNSSPIFFFALLGWAMLLAVRDRRILVVVGLYGATAATNGLHPDWGFGFCYPARFLMTAMPAIIYGLAIALPQLMKKPLAVFLAALALAVSVESLVQTLGLPEAGYDGRNLLGRSLNDFYPYSLHFFPPNQTDTPFFDWSFWLLLAAALYAWLVYCDKKPASWRWGLGFAAALLPFLWGQSATASTRLDYYAFSPYMTRILPGYPIDRPNSLEYPVSLRPMQPQAHQPNGRIAAQTGVPASLINASRFSMPLLNLPYPGIYQITMPDLSASHAAGKVAGHLMLTSRQTVQAVSPWEKRISYPLVGGREPQRQYIFHVERPEIRYIYLEYSGSGQLALGQIDAKFTPRRSFAKSSKEIHRVTENLESAQGQGIVLGYHYPDLPQGHYRVRYRMRGSTLGTLFQREPEPMLMAVYADTQPAEDMERLARAWFAQERVAFATSSTPDYYRPLAEEIQPPWLTALPWTDDDFELSFFQPKEQGMWFLFRYDGDLDLQVESIDIYQDFYEGL
jgi:hypothetical protein